jgi:hypothetical protein
MSFFTLRALQKKAVFSPTWREGLFASLEKRRFFTSLEECGFSPLLRKGSFRLFGGRRFFASLEKGAFHLLKGGFRLNLDVFSQIFLKI